MNGPLVYLVSEGETYYDAWIAHAVFRDREVAMEYAADLAKSIDGQRWPNVQIMEFVLDVPGGKPLAETGDKWEF